MTRTADEEEQGIDVGRLARGLFRVTPPATRGTSPVLALRAPLLLQTIAVEPRTAAENDYTVDLTGDVEVNPVLLYALHRQYGVDFDLDSVGEQLNAMLGEIDSAAAQIEKTYQVLANLVRRQGLSAELDERTHFIHPRQQLEKDFLPDQDTVALCWGPVHAVLNDLEEHRV